MIVANQQEVTEAVLAELARAPDPRFREIMGAAVRHLHGFAREARLTEAEFQQACGWIAKLGQLTTPSHNEVVLTAGSLGLSALVCLLNNGDGGRPRPRPTSWARSGAWTRRARPMAARSCGRRRRASPFGSGRR